MAADVNVNSIREAVHEKYMHVAESPEGYFTYPVGRAGAVAVGYGPELLRGVPEDVLRCFCGVGNPFSLGAIHDGETVLDVGCGAGVDLVIAARLVGPHGRVCGIDLVPRMTERARANAAAAGAAAVEVQVAPAESIPYADATFDVVISNGTFNLSPLKQQAFAEVYRVLRPAGRLQFADIVLDEALPPEVVGSLDAWSD